MQVSIVVHEANKLFIGEISQGNLPIGNRFKMFLRKSCSQKFI